MKFPICLLGLLLASATFGVSAPTQLWLYCSQNLWVDKNVDALEALFQRAARAGYTHVLLADSKFSKLEDMDEHYFRNVRRVRKSAAASHLEIVPALFAVGYSNDLLWHDPNLIEAMPVQDALFVVREGKAALQSDHETGFKGGDCSDLKRWAWHDPIVTSEEGTAVIRNPAGENARLVQKLNLRPFRQYHISARIKTQDFRGTPEIKILAGNLSLNYGALGVKPTQAWKVHHAVFNSLTNASAHLYLGAWGARGGTVWFDDVTVEEVGLVNLVRRPGGPLSVKREGGEMLSEGADFDRVLDPNMGVHPWKGAYDIYHSPPVLKLKRPLPDGTRLRVSYYHGVTVNEDQAMICPSEAATPELLRDQARRMHAAWGARGYMMSHDEIRVLNWCDACRRRNLDAGALLAENVRSCVKILREVNPGGRIYVWSDMFDPNHNAHGDYYLVRGSLAGSWEGVDKDVTVVPWYFEKRAESLKFFAHRGHRQIIAGYYDDKPEQVRDWLSAAEPYPGVEGVMYTTWRNDYKDLERFAESVKGSRPRP